MGVLTSDVNDLSWTVLIQINWTGCNSFFNDLGTLQNNNPWEEHSVTHNEILQAISP